MPAWLTTSWQTVGLTVVATVGIYATILVCTRIGGLRSFAKMSSFDFAATVAVGSMLASVALSPDQPLTVGVVAVVTLYVAQLGLAALRRFRAVHGAVDNPPLLLMDGDRVLHDNLRRGRMTEDELRAKLREANVLRPGEIRAVVLESTGDVSVLHGPPDGAALDPGLLEHVRGADRLARH